MENNELTGLMNQRTELKLRIQQILSVDSFGKIWDRFEIQGDF